MIYLSVSLFGYSQKKYTISGYISDKNNGETIVVQSIYSSSNGKGVSSNTYGFYSLTLEEGLYEINYTFLGYKTEKKQIQLNKNIDLNIGLVTSSYTIDEVEVKGSSNIVQKTQASVIEVPIEQIKSIPASFW